jgi:acetyl esterase/lipase
MGSSAGGHLAASVSVHYDKKMYEDTIERLPDSKFFPYVCSEFERLWREVSTDYSDDKFVIQWK